MIYFLGGGNMAEAIIVGLCNNGRAKEIFVCDKSVERLQYLHQKYEVQVSPQLPELAADDVIILAIKPQDAAMACATIQLNGALVISIIAGLSMQTLSLYLSKSERIVRVMPNTPCQVGVGVAGIFASSAISLQDKSVVECILAPSSYIIWLNQEDEIHGITGVSGSGPAYVFYLMNALLEAAKISGFDDATAYHLTLQTFKGAVALAEHSGEDFQALQDKVTSKGGTTFAALETFRRLAVAEGIQQGVKAAILRSKEMAGQ